MSVFRSYFSKNDTLIQSNLTNNSQNPVTEISYGTLEKQVSRFIFDVNFDALLSKIQQGFIVPNASMRHTLHMTNTIRYAPQYIGKKSYSESIERASSFSLDFFNVTEDWQEGSGYDFTYSDKQDLFVEQPLPVIGEQAANWTARTTGVRWAVDGAYISGVSQIIGSQQFEVGNESIEIDVTDYVNQRLFGTGYTGTSAYTGNSFGLGIKFPHFIEDLETEYRQAVAFHAKQTNTFYEPYIETTVDDIITDDRNYFFLDKDNDLYIYVNIGNFPQDITVNKVDIYDYEDKLIDTLSGTSIVNTGKGVYKITLNISSADYPDAVLFKDVWSVTINGRATTFEGEFYLISQKNYYTFNLSNEIDFRNYYFYFWGINEKENIRANGTRKIRLTVKELYPNQSNFLPLEIEYRLYTTVGAKYQIDIIPFTPVNRTSNGYEFDLDTSWLIPQDYYLELRLKNGNYYETKQSVAFTIVSDGIIIENR
jgi:hypothetical protein